MSVSSVFSHNISVSLLSLDHQTLPLFQHNGRYYVEAVHKLKYLIQVLNFSAGNLEVLAAVDGRDTKINQVADLAIARGWLVGSFESQLIHGWGTRATTPFMFTYFERETMAVKATGSNAKLGVIAVASFTERERPKPIQYGSPHLFAKGGFESLVRGGSGVGTGTDPNDVKHHNVQSASFIRSNEAPTIVEIFAKPYWWLVENGVIFGNRNDPDHPSGFSRPDRSDYGL